MFCCLSFPKATNTMTQILVLLLLILLVFVNSLNIVTLDTDEGLNEKIFNLAKNKYTSRNLFCELRIAANLINDQSIFNDIIYKQESLFCLKSFEKDCIDFQEYIDFDIDFKNDKQMLVNATQDFIHSLRQLQEDRSDLFNIASHHIHITSYTSLVDNIFKDCLVTNDDEPFFDYD